MKRIPALLSVVFTVFIVMFAVGCPTTGSSKSCETQSYPLTLSSAAAADPCEYQPVNIPGGSGCILLTMSADATGGTHVPDLSGVTFQWITQGQSSSRSPTPTANGWTANTNAIGCSSPPGCADGDFTIEISNPNNYACTDFGAVTLNLGFQ